MKILGRSFAGEKRRSTEFAGCFSSVNLLLVVVFLGNRLQETDASHQAAISVHRQQRSSLTLEPYDDLTEDEKRSVVTIEYNIQHVNSSSISSNFLTSVYLKTREVIVSQLNREPFNTADSTVATTTSDSNYDTTSTTTTTRKPISIGHITIIVTLPPPHAAGKRRRRNEEVTYKEDDLDFVENYPEIIDHDLRISIFIRRKAVSLRIQKLHQVVNSTEFKNVLQTEVQAPVVRIYTGMPSNVLTRNSSARLSSDFSSLWISVFLCIIHALCSVDTLNSR